MAKYVLTDVSVTIGTAVLSSSLAAVTIELSADEVETTAFGGGGWRSRVSGLKTGTVSFDYHGDYGTGAIDGILWTAFNAGTAVAVTVKPAGTAASATNPVWSFNALPVSYSPVAGSIGDLATSSLAWPIDGPVVRGTA